MALDEVLIDSDAFREFLRERTSVSNISREMYRQACEETATYIENTASDQNGPFYAKQFASRATLLNYCTLKKRGVPGLALEFGVGDGTTLRWIARERFVHGFDSFEGLPEDWRSEFPKGHFKLDKYTRQEVSEIENSIVWTGLFEDSLPEWHQLYRSDLVREGIAFIHIDCDLYSSTKTVLDQLAPWIKSGTILLFDEYWNYPGWDRSELGEFHAFGEWWNSVADKFDGAPKCLGWVTDGEQMAVQIP